MKIMAQLKKKKILMVLNGPSFSIDFVVKYDRNISGIWYFLLLACL